MSTPLGGPSGGAAAAGSKTRPGTSTAAACTFGTYSNTVSPAALPLGPFWLGGGTASTGGGSNSLVSHRKPAPPPGAASGPLVSYPGPRRRRSGGDAGGGGGGGAATAEFSKGPGRKKEEGDLRIPVMAAM